MLSIKIEEIVSIILCELFSKIYKEISFVKCFSQYMYLKYNKKNLLLVIIPVLMLFW